MSYRPLHLFTHRPNILLTLKMHSLLFINNLNPISALPICLLLFVGHCFGGKNQVQKKYREAAREFDQ